MRFGLRRMPSISLSQSTLLKTLVRMDGGRVPDTGPHREDNQRSAKVEILIYVLTLQDLLTFSVPYTAEDWRFNGAIRFSSVVLRAFWEKRPHGATYQVMVSSTFMWAAAKQHLDTQYLNECFGRQARHIETTQKN